MLTTKLALVLRRWFSTIADLVMKRPLETFLLGRFGGFLLLHLSSLASGEEGFNAVPYGGLDDGRIYYESARQLADGENPVVNNSYPVVLSWLFGIGIDQIWLIKLANTAAGICAILVLARLASDAKSKPGDGSPLLDPGVLLLAGLFPAAVFWSSNSIMRDGWIFLLVALVLWWAGRLTRRVSPGPTRVAALIPLAALGIALSTLRWYAVGLLVVSIALAWPTSSWMWLRRNRMQLVLPSLVGVFIVAHLGNELVDSAMGVRPLDYRSNPLLDGGSELEIDFRSHGVLASIPLYLWSVLSNAFGPFPWQAKSPLQLVPALIELPFQIVIVTRLWRQRGSQNSTAHLLWVFGMIWLATLGLWNDSLGNATRIRVIGWMALATASCSSELEVEAGVASDEDPIAPEPETSGAEQVKSLTWGS